MKNSPIAFLDSGIGGVSILKEVMKYLPNENYIYYADSEHNPYGEKTKEELFNIIDDIVKKLLEYKPKLIVVACNTATTMILSDIRSKYKEVTFIGTEPALKVIHDKYPDKKSIVLATKGTEYSKRFKELCNLYQTRNTSIVEVNELANLIETDSNNIDSYLTTKLTPYIGIEVVVLGCTHFPFIKQNITNILGKVTFIDSSLGITKRIYRTLKCQNNLNDESGSLLIIGNNAKKEKINKIILDK